MNTRTLGVAVTTITLVVLSASLAHDDNDDEVAADEVIRAETNVFHSPIRLSAEDGVIDTGKAWGHCGPWYEDIDGDGKKDLLVGDFSGFFRFYRNVGTNQEPKFAKAINLRAGGEDAKVPIY